MSSQALSPVEACGGKPGAPDAVGAHRILRERMDPHTGERWLLVPNPDDPAGPGQWARSGEVRSSCTVHKKIVIRRGDPVVVEEHTETIDALLEATALEPAAAGSSFSVRLKIGGRALRVAAIAAGRAEVER